MLYLDVGDGKTYSSIANALAAIPDPLTDHCTIRLYASATAYTNIARIVFPSNSMPAHKYALAIVGVVGDIRTDDQIEVSFASGVIGVDYSAWNDYGLSFSNIKFTVTGSGYVMSPGFGAHYAMFNKLHIVSENNFCVYAPNVRIYAYGCIFESTGGHAIRTDGQASLLQGCLIKAKSTGVYTTGNITILDSTVISTDGHPMRGYTQTRISNSIITGSSDCFFLDIDEFSSVPKGLFWERNIFHSTTGSLSSSYTLAQIESIFPARILNCSDQDPLLAEIGSAKEYSVLDVTSPALASNIGASPNLFHETLDDPKSIGSYSNYTAPDFPEVGNVTTDDTVDGEAGTCVQPTEADVKLSVGFGADGTEFTGSLSLGTPPAAPAIGTITATDGGATVPVTPAAETDTVFLRYRLLPSGSWSAENALFSRTGSGNISITGLTNFSRYATAAYSKNSALTSDWSKAATFTPTDGSSPLVDRLVDAVAATVTDLSLTTADSTAYTVSTEFPPRWEDRAVPSIFVSPGATKPRPMMGGATETEISIQISVCEQGDSDAQLAARDRLIADVQAALLADRRPISGTWISADPLGESRPYEATDITDYNIKTAFTVKYMTRS